MPDTPPDLSTLLRNEGRSRSIGGNEPFLLDDADTAWLVEEGKVEIFALDAGKAGRRAHVTSVEAGGMIFGAGSAAAAVPDEGSAKLLAVAMPETRLRELSTPRLRELAREAAGLPALARAVDGWIAALLAGVAPAAAPRHFVELEPGSEVLLDEEGKAARPGRGVVWVRHVAGSTRFLGRPELELEPAGFLLPLSQVSWLTSAAPDTTLSCVETALLLRSGGVWEGLAGFHRLFLDYLALEGEEASTEERLRLRKRHDFDQRALRSAYLRLANVLRPSVDAEAGGEEAADPLFEACRLVAETQDIDLRRPPEEALAGTPAHRLARICEASRVRHRLVILRDDWWRRDNGPLVGFLQEDKRRRPVALLPTSPRSYELVDPGEQRRLPLGPDLAEQLAGAAHMFYPPLPERPLRKLDLVRAALRGRRRDLVMVLLMGLGGGVLGMLVPIVTGYLFGNVIPDADRPQLAQMTLALVVAAFAAAAFQITRSIAVLRLSGKMDGSLQAAVWDRLLALPASFFRRFTVGDLANRSMGIDAIRNLVVGRATTSVLAAIFSLFSFFLLFYYSPRLALLASGLVGVMVAVAALLAFLQLRHQRQLLYLQGKLSSLVFGLIHGVAKLRVAGAEPHAFALWAERFSEQRRRTLQAQRIANLQTSFNGFYPIVTALGIFAMVGVTAEADLPVSRFLAFNAAFGQFQAAALTVVALLSDVLMVVPIYERVRPILEAVPEVDETKAVAGELAGDVEFSHVSFRYQADGPLILDDVSFRARPGEFIALVGPSGSGKSTCLRLLLGFEQPASGSIYFDGQDLPSLDLASVRRQIGVVLQDGRPMAGDIFTNIVGNANLKLEDAWEAARMAGLADDIKKMPMGMHTVISEGAGTFSGGQIQRLLIARAIVSRPRVLLFDEATSALDNRTQEIVSQSLEHLKATRVIIAHRLSTIRHADRIYVLEGGRLIEEGTYDDLAARGGVFGRLVERQIA